MNYTITKDSGVPAYIQLYNYLVQDIVAGIYPLDSRLPSKRIIAEETGVSLITVEHTMNHKITAPLSRFNISFIT